MLVIGALVAFGALLGAVLGWRASSRRPDTETEQEWWDRQW